DPKRARTGVGTRAGGAANARARRRGVPTARARGRQRATSERTVTEPAFRSAAPAPAAARRRVAPPWSKRALDLVITVPLLVLLSPLLFVIAIAIKLNSRGPVLFKQSRVGLGEQPFLMY